MAKTTKTTHKTRTTTTTPAVTPMALLAALDGDHGRTDLGALLAGADAALPTLLGEGGAFLNVTAAVDGLNDDVRPNSSRTIYREELDRALDGFAPMPGCTESFAEACNAERTATAEAAFAIGLAAGMRLAGGR